jgi:flagellar hook assembly protein FlgD
MAESTVEFHHEFRLMSNFPNPFNPETMIPFTLANDGEATLSIYNITGQRVTTLIDGRQPEGYHVVRWNGCDETGLLVASGIYFARLDAGSLTQTKKLMMLK